MLSCTIQEFHSCVHTAVSIQGMVYFAVHRCSRCTHLLQEWGAGSGSSHPQVTTVITFCTYESVTSGYAVLVCVHAYMYMSPQPSYRCLSVKMVQ
jgi:hypothetical protein